MNLFLIMQTLLALYTSSHCPFKSGNMFGSPVNPWQTAKANTKFVGKEVTENAAGIKKLSFLSYISTRFLPSLLSTGRFERIDSRDTQLFVKDTQHKELRLKEENPLKYICKAMQQ